MARASTGFDPLFLGSAFRVPLPTFSGALSGDVVTAEQLPRTDFQDGAYVRYIHYSVATNRERRQPIVVALNIDQDLIKSAQRGGWRTDPRVGDFQLDNGYYRRNPYDRGHLARRSTAAWGDTAAEAKAASDDTMFYTNAALQHENFNQDEWLFLEDWVKDLVIDSTNKISVFSGPIYTSSIDASQFIGSPPAPIPTAFFKLVVYIDRQGELATRAFIMAQDAFALSNKNARSRRFDLAPYQVSTSLIEDETGLVFDQKLRDSNPIRFTGTPVPPIIPVDDTTMQPDRGGTMPKAATDAKIRIICAMVNARGDETRNEWVTIFNFGASDVDLSGWTLSDRRRTPLSLSSTLRSGEAQRINALYSSASDTGVRLPNRSGQIVLLTPDGAIEDRVTYSNSSRVIREGVPVTFHLDEHVAANGVNGI